MIRFNPGRNLAKAAGALALGLTLGIGASTAHAQVAATATAPRYAAPAPPYRATYVQPTYGSSPYGYGGYYGSSLNGYNRGPVGTGPVRDWSTGRQVRLAKPWMRPLPR